MNDSAATTTAAEAAQSHDRAGRSYAPHLALVLVQMTFGSLPVVGKVVLKVIPSFAVVGFRVGVTAAALLLVQALRGDLRLERRGDYWRFAVLSFFGVTLNQLLSISGLSLTKASNASLLASTIPIFALTVGSLFGVEQLRKAAVFGILVAAAGVVVLIDPRNASFSSETTLGDILIILNSLSYGIYVVFSKDVITRNGALKSTAWVFIFAALICVPLGFYSFSAIDSAGVAAMIWLALLYIALV
ncbi:MAG: DMT family transporter, partial [Acidobacteriota bacterium]|nr:DMT family transporter [Acidobacteriota bacterium]